MNGRREAAGGNWSIEKGGRILDVYTPRSFALAKAAQDKRRRSKKTAERQNKRRAKV